ncbi:DapH/DapD/GlmU-related protein [Microbacterium sp. RU33B]|uniref:acyltransferase n=1 Tax=Microbacterium sp. RU33B TaxID=1907390 RepID=UPI00095FE044|nr:acyltransferase [Microbacterium sp. RU33B]SIT68447.1 transferase hexapeptide (six repeat-containing protein) [Microbacterium sp. RU33B]
MISPFEHSPWDFWTRADAEAHAAQRALQSELLASHPTWTWGEECFISDHASVDDDELVLGDRTYIAAGAYLTGTLRAGADCSINPYTVLRGRIELGDGVRIGAHTSILGFNHTMSDPDRPVFRQPLTSKGIVIGEDVWIGSHVVILDGVDVGAHSVLAAGAVVTKDVPAGAVVGGSPARFLKWRIEPVDPLADRVAAFGDAARAAASEILERSWDASAALFVDRPGAAPTVRAQCDAIEIADLLLGTAPPQLPADVQVDRLRGWQDAATGAVPALGASVVDLADPDVAYHVECVGYALDLLGSGFAHPLPALAGRSAAEVASFLDSLPWEDEAWSAGHGVDAVGTALHWSLRRGDAVDPGYAEALLGWLVTRTDAATGVWGGGELLQRVNGFYRASRGTFAQFGVPVPHPRALVDTVLAHASDPALFAPAAQNACNVLDVAHPLWLSPGHRSAEVTALARRLLADALDHWDAGFAFHPGAADAAPGLQGTEMWLAIVWYLSDLVGLSDCLGYRPRGIHRPEPAASLM